MIKEVAGDILLTEAEAIAHGVAPMDHFDKGLALSLRENYPSMVKDFRHYCKVHNATPGDAWIWSGVGGVRIINLMTQEAAIGYNGHPGDTTLPWVNHALKELAKIVKKKKIKSLAITKLATGLGNLDWDEVRPLIYEKLGELNIPIYIYTLYQEGEKAEEI